MSNLRILVPMTLGQKARAGRGLFRAGALLFAVWPALAGADLNSALDNSEIFFTTGGAVQWQEQFIVFDPEGDGDAAESGAIGDSQESFIEAIIDQPGNISFSWKVDSEGCWPFLCDVLEFSLDGVALGQIQGWQDWHRIEFSIPPGTHVLRWTYRKDGSILLGADRGWLDRVSFRPLNMDGGPLIVAPNVMDRSIPDPRVRIVARGKSFQSIEVRIFNEIGICVNTISGSADADGVAVMEFDGHDSEGRRLGTGIYYAVMDGWDGPEKASFAIMRREKK